MKAGQRCLKVEWQDSFHATIYRGSSNFARIGYRLLISQTNEDSESLNYEIDYAQQGMDEDHSRFIIYSRRTR
jgi:hypothetical protein